MKRLIFTLIIGWELLSGSFVFAADAVAVIVNKNTVLFKESDGKAVLKNIMNIYLGKTRMAGGALVVPTLQEDKKITALFLKESCALSPNEYKTYWLKLELSDALEPPRTLATSAEVIEQVQAEKAAIGYVWENEAQGREDIKVIYLIKE